MILVKAKSPGFHLKSKTAPEKTYEEKLKEEEKMIRVFDGSASTIKHIAPVSSVKPLEERQEIKVFGDDCNAAAKAIF